MSYLSTHVLDTARGMPGVGIPVTLEQLGTGAGFSLLASGVTDSDGRVGDLGPDELPGGTYRLTFDTTGYYGALGETAFFPTITITFTTDPDERHYHVPVLLSPFAYSTYRGS